MIRITNRSAAPQPDGNNQPLANAVTPPSGMAMINATAVTNNDPTIMPSAPKREFAGCQVASPKNVPKPRPTNAGHAPAIITHITTNNIPAAALAATVRAMLKNQSARWGDKSQIHNEIINCG
jgi:hypothetical protein